MRAAHGSAAARQRGSTAARQQGSMAAGYDRTAGQHGAASYCAQQDHLARRGALGEVLQPLWHVAKDVGAPLVCPALDELGRCLFETECGSVVGRRHAVLAAELDDLPSLLTASLEML